MGDLKRKSQWCVTLGCTLKTSVYPMKLLLVLLLAYVQDTLALVPCATQTVRLTPTCAAPSAEPSTRRALFATLGTAALTVGYAGAAHAARVRMRLLYRSLSRHTLI
jgi:hypothetical protein